MTPKQKENYNRMLHTLKRISTYRTPEQLRRNSEREYGISVEEALEYAYENIQQEAKYATNGIRPIK